MDMTNPIKAAIRKIREKHRSSVSSAKEGTINSSVLIKNDTRDPENKVYIYVNGIPVALVGKNNSKDCNCISFEDAGRFVSNIKNMYSKILDNEKIM